MKRIYTLFLLTLFLNISYSQVPIIEWQKTYGGSDSDEGKSICLTNNGGYAVTGYTQSSDGYISNHHLNEDV